MIKAWIKKAIKNPGALRRTAKRHGALGNGIDEAWLDKAAAGKGVSKKTQKRAGLAKTLRKIRRK